MDMLQNNNYYSSNTFCYFSIPEYPDLLYVQLVHWLLAFGLIQQADFIINNFV